MPRLPSPLRLVPTLVAVTAAWLATACAPGGGDPAPGGGGGGGNGGGGGGLPQVEWGAIPPEPRLPGEVAPATFLPEFHVENHGIARKQTVRVSVPFPWTQVHDIERYSVQGEATAWRVLQRWPDGSVRVAQAQFTTQLAGNERRDYRIVPQPASEVGPFVPNPAFAAGLPSFGAEVRDPFGVVYRTLWHAPAAVLEETPLVRVRRVRGYHTAINGVGIGRDYLTSTFYVTELRDQPVVVVDWILGNDYLGADDPQGSADPNLYPLGAIDLDYAAFIHRDAHLALPYRPATNLVEPVEFVSGGYQAFPVMRDTFLGDGQTRRYRFVLLRDDPTANGLERIVGRATAQAMVDDPLRPLATLQSWQDTHALGLLGGPVTGPADALQRALAELGSWHGTAQFFGVWGSRGDPKVTGQTGTPRNQPLTAELAHSVQANDGRLLEVLEQKAWIQAARPYHLFGLRVEDEDDLLLWDGVPLYLGSRDLSRESLGRRRFFGNDPYAVYRQRIRPGSQRANGWEHFDVEHFTMDLLFDYWTVSGDAWANEELRQLGESLRGLLRPTGYNTSRPQAVRAEGWTMQALVQAFLATGDLRFRDFALDRAHFIVDPVRPDHPSGALLFDGSSARTGFPFTHEYYMPWQHAALVYGYLAAWKFFGDPLLLEICEAVPRAVGYAWVRDYNDPTFGFVANGLRYYVPVSHEGQLVPPDVFDSTVGVQFGGSPLGGSHVMLLGGLMLLADTTADPATRELCEIYGGLIEPPPFGAAELWGRWHYCVPERYVR